MKVSKDLVQTAQAHHSSTELLLQLGIISHHVNEFLFHADNSHYHQASALRRYVSSSIASQAALSAIDPLVYEGREILFNKVANLHTDSQDPPYSWAVLTAFGNTTSVMFQVPQLNMRIAFNPGDLLAIRGRVLKHSTSRWKCGQRIVIPHFTHSSSWRYAGYNSVFSRGPTS